MTTRSLSSIAALTAILLLSGCGAPENEPTNGVDTASAAPSQAANTAEVTRTVVQRHLETFGNGDLEGIMADYAEDAVFFTPQGPIVGKQAIREAFVGFIEEWDDPSTTFELTEEYYEGEHGYVNWTAETPANVYSYGADGFTVRDSLIQVQFFAADITPKAQ